MSIRHQFSYWLTATPVDPRSPRTDELLQALDAAGLLAPEGPLVAKIGAGHVLAAEVDPKNGTVEEDSCLADMVDGVAKGFPDYDVELRELDEEDHANACATTWAGGARQDTKYARLVDPGDYDRATAAAISEHLHGLGMDDAADAVDAEFPPD